MNEPFFEVPGVFVRARQITVLCLECAENDREGEIAVDLEHGNPLEVEDIEASTFRVRCPRCSDAFGEACFVIVQILTGPQLDLVDGAGDGDTGEVELEELPEHQGDEQE